MLIKLHLMHGIADTEIIESGSKITSDWENMPSLEIKFHGEKQFCKEKLTSQKPACTHKKHDII